MLTVYHSNQIDVLKSLLINLIQLDPLDSPFEREQILVQSPGMSQWLKIELAEEMGIAANLAFPLPATFIWSMFVEVLDDVPQKSVFNKESVTWKLMQVLPTLLENAEFYSVKRYLVQDVDGSKLYQLCEKIADIFDGYLVYRPEWISAWEQDREVAELNGEQPWQKMLWQALYRHTVNLGHSPYHRANLYEQFIQKLQDDSFSAANLPKRLFVFGISSLPPRYMDALAALGKHIDVHLMFTNPCRQYWGEIRDRKYLSRVSSDEGSENNLLASMGKLGRDNIFLLSQLSSNEITAFVDIKRETLLNQIQADILDLEERQDDSNLLTSLHKNQIDIEDRSLSLHACHSPMREVEVLHDRLLEMFEENPQLKPKDIIVMVADINAYSASIQAVFGNAQGKNHIPYSISDRSVSEVSPLLKAFLRLLSLPDSRCSAPEILELLETPEILRKFSIGADEFEIGKRWVEQTGIRWGLDQNTAEEFSLPRNPQNTWLFGIQRMLLGYAMHPSVELFRSNSSYLSPFSDVQGMDADLAGKLADFIHKVSNYRTLLAKSQTIEEWQSLLYKMTEQFFDVGIEGELALKAIRDALLHLTEQLQDAAYVETISPAIIIHYLQNKLSGSKASQRFLAGQVNFCTLTPMRSIPFDTVCLLGMNDGVYPRVKPSEGLDLMNGRAKPGDRSRRDDDRYLFLEALLSAQRALYISYLSRSIQDNTPRSPSILVSELLEYCGQNFCLNGHENLTSDESSVALADHLTTQYPMVPFSPHAYSEQYRSYAKEWLPAANRIGHRALPFIQPLPDYRTTTEQSEQLSFSQLLQFWHLPVQFFFNQRLKVFFDQLSVESEENEPFSLDSLQSYKLRDALLDTQLKARNAYQTKDELYHAFVQKHRARGELPVGAFGEMTLLENQEQALQLIEALSEYCQYPEDDVEVCLTIELADHPVPIHISGWIKGRYQDGLIRYRSGNIRSQDQLTAWIEHLCLTLMGYRNPTRLFGYNSKTGVEQITINPVESAQARAWLTELVECYFNGLNKPLAYFPKTALVAAEQFLSGKGDQYAKMEACFSDGFNYQGEGSNPYIQRVWPMWDNLLAEATIHTAQKILLPLLQHSEYGKRK